MKYYVMVEGKLVEATMEQVADLSIQLYDAEGVEVQRKQAKTENTLEQTVLNIAKRVENLVADREEEKKAEAAAQKAAADAVAAKELEDLKAKVASYEAAAAKGFPIAGAGGVVVAGEDNTLFDFCNKFYDYRYQGRKLMNKMDHPLYQITEESRKELFEFFSLVAMMSTKNDHRRAMGAAMMEKYYEDKTVIGDTGNTFPIPDIVEGEIWWFARERSIILQYGRIFDMTSDKQSWPRETGSSTVAWGNTTSQSDPTVEEFELDTTELSCYTAARNDTLMDTRSDIVSWLTENLSEAAGLELDNKSFNGLGTDSPFICSGILSAACGNSVVMDSGSTAFSNLSSTNLSKMISALDGVRKIGARYFAHGEVLHFVRDLKDDNNRPIFVDTYGSNVPGGILGYPYTEVTNMTSTTAANTAFLAFGNPQNFAVGRRLGFTSLDVNPYQLWTTNRTAYKLYSRWALGMGLPAGFVRLLTAAS